jgi:hypothetical protein
VFQGFDVGERGGEKKEEREIDGEGVVLLVGGDGEEDQDEGGEEAEKKSGALREAERSGALQRGAKAVALLPAEYGGGGSEEAPGKEPDEVQRPVEVAGELVVVVRNAMAEEAGDVLVVEIEPGPAGA